MVREEVIQVEAAGAFAHEGEAADWLDAALGHLAATDWASLGTTAHGDMLRRLQGGAGQADRGERGGAGGVHRGTGV